MARVISEMLEPDNLIKYRSGSKKAARELCWEHEQSKLIGAFGGVETKKKGSTICILARKNIWRTGKRAHWSNFTA